MAPRALRALRGRVGGQFCFEAAKVVAAWGSGPWTAGSLSLGSFWCRCF